MAFLTLEPPAQGANERTAAIMATLYNASGNMRRGKTMKASDFLPKKKLAPQSAEQQIAQFKKFTRIFS